MTARTTSTAVSFEGVVRKGIERRPHSQLVMGGPSAGSPQPYPTLPAVVGQRTQVRAACRADEPIHSCEDQSLMAVLRDWRLKAAVQGVLSVLPASQRLNLPLQQLMGSLPQPPWRFEESVAVCRDHLDLVRPLLERPLAETRFARVRGRMGPSRRPRSPIDGVQFSRWWTSTVSPHQPW